LEQCDPQPEDVVVMLGQGPIGLMFTMLVKRAGATIVATDTMPSRRAVARDSARVRSAREDVARQVRELTEGRGADLVIVAPR
jgi:L-iditol 2-dehydrogenase